MKTGDMSILDCFRKHGMQASYHYADDTCKEWDSGDAEKRKALKLFDDNPALQGEMRETAKTFLWAYTFKQERPETVEMQNENG